MIRVIVQDASAVTLNGQSVTGPIDVLTHDALVGATTYDEGVIVVRSGAAVQVLTFDPVHVQAAPYAILVFFVLGVFICASWFRR